MIGAGGLPVRAGRPGRNQYGMTGNNFPATEAVGGSGVQRAAAHIGRSAKGSSRLPLRAIPSDLSRGATPHEECASGRDVGNVARFAGRMRGIVGLR